MRINFKNKIIVLLAVAVVAAELFALLFNFSEAQLISPRQIEMTAYILGNDNKEVANGEYDVKFAIYPTDRTDASAIPGSPLWQETQKVQIENGILRAYLGATTAIPGSLNFGVGTYFLGMTIGTDEEMIPRKKIGATPLAISALNALSAQSASSLSGAIPGTAEGDLLVLGRNGKIDIRNLPTGTSGNTLVLSNDLPEYEIEISGSYDYLSADGMELTLEQVDLASDITGTLSIGNGGTGISSYSAGDVLYYSSGNTLSRLSAGIDGEVLTILSGVPAWQSPGAAGMIDGAGVAGEVTFWTDANTLDHEAHLNVSRGGTGFGGPYFDGDFIYYSGGQFTRLGIGLNGQILGAIGGVPTWQTSSFVGAHNLLSTVHPDTVSASPLPGDLITGMTVSGSNRWNRYAIGSPNQILMVNGGGNGISWSAQTSITQLGTITAGTWNGTTIAVGRGGTGITSAPTDGQLLIGGTGTGYSLATIAAGSGVSVANGSGSILISSTLNAGGTLLGLSGTTFSLREGTLSDGDLCVYDATQGLVCATPIGSVGHSPVTIGSPANGLSIDGSQQLSIVTASGSATGVLSSTDWSTFNAKQNALTIGNLVGTANQVTVTGGTGSIIGSGVTLSLPQNIAITSAPIFGGLTLNGTLSVQGGSYHTILQGGAQSQDITYTLPTSQAGGSDLVLSNDGSGNLSWASVSGVGGTSGTGIENQVAYWTGTSSLSGENQLSPSRGGTGVNGSTAGNGTLLIGNGTGYSLANLTAGSNIAITNASGAITLATSLTPTFTTVNSLSLTANADGFQISGGTTPRTLTLTGGNITLSGGGNTLTLTGSATLNQNLRSTDTPIFGGLTLTGMSGVLKATAGILSGSATTDDLTEGTTNLYYTDARSRAAISTSVTGLTYTSASGVLSLTDGYVIPTTTQETNWGTAYTNRITSASLPLSISGNAISISQSSSTTNGYLSSTDWSTFNAKQNALTIGNLVGTANQVTVTGGTGSIIGSGVTLSLPQNIAITSAPIFGGLTLNGTLSVQGGSYTTTLQGGAQSQDITYTLPTSQAGGSDLVLSNDGSGNLSWASVSGVGGTSGSGSNGQVAFWTGTSSLSGENQLSPSRGGTGVNGSTAGNGTLLIGNGTGYSLANLTAGSNIAITNASGAITLATSLTPTFTTVNSLSLTANADGFQISGGTTPRTLTLTGGNITLSGGGNTLTLTGSATLNQNLRSTDTPIFGGLTLTGMSGVLKATAGILSGSATTDDLTEGTTNLYYTDARSRAAVSTSATGLTYTSASGVLSLTDGYVIPTTGSQVNTWTAPLNFSGNVASLNYNATNLKVTSNALNTIQDIATTSMPVFGGLTLNGNLITNGTLSVQGGSYHTVFQGSASQAGNVSYTLPENYPGDNGYILTSTTAGILQWVSPGAASISLGGSIEGGASAGSVLYIDSENKLAQDSENFNWNGTTHMLGLGTDSPASRLTIDGGMAIGASYLSIAAPTSGAIIEGNVGIGNSNPAQKLSVNGTLGIASTNPSYYTIFQGGNQGTNNITYTLPVSVPGNDDGYVLKINSLNNLYWEAVTGGSGGAGTVTSITAGNGLTVSVGSNPITSSGTLAVNLLGAGTTSSTTSSYSGLEIVDGKLALIHGCSVGQVLSWDNVGQAWKCDSVSGIGGLTGSGSENQVAFWSGANSLSGENQLSPLRGGTGVNGSTAGNGTLLIGKGDGFNLTTLTAGSNIAITNGTGTISLATSLTPIFTTVNALSLTANADGFAVAGGTTPRTLTLTGGNITLSGGGHTLTLTGSSTLNQNLRMTDTPIFAGLTLNGNLSIQGGSYTTILQGGAQSQDITYTLPTSQAGGSDLVLSNDGSGNLSWASVSGVGGTSGSGSNGQVAFWTGTSSLSGENQLSPSRGGTGVNGSTAGNGTLLIGNGTGYNLTTLTAGSNIAITNGAGTISLATSLTPTFTTVNALSLTANADGFAISGGTTPRTLTLTGGSITLSGGGNTLTLTGSATLNQNLRSTDTPIFGGLTLTGMSGVLKATAGILSGSATTDDLTEGTTNLYYTDARSRAAVSTSATGLTYTSASGVLSLTDGYVIPTTTQETNWGTAYTNRITSASLPLSISGNAISISQSSSTTNGYLSSTDWSTFNAKQNALTIGNLVGTANQVTVTGGTGSIIGSGVTLSLPQNIAITSAPIFGGLTLNGTLSVQGGSYHTILQGGAQSQDITYTLPTSQAGGSDLVLSNDGSGNLSWASVSGVGGTSGTGIENQVAYWTGTSSLSGENQLSPSRGGTGVNGSTAGNGTLLIGNGTGYSLANLTAGSNIAITNASGAITLATSLTPTFTTVNSLSLTANADGFQISGGTTPRTLTLTGGNITLSGGGNTLTLTGSATLNQNLRSTDTPIFGGLTLTGMSGVLKATAGILSGSATTDDLTEGTTNLYYTDARSRAAVSTSATGLTYTSASGVLSLTDGYVIPTTTQETNWGTAYTNRITSASLPLSISGNAISLGYSATNLKLTSNQLDTIQDIATTSTPTFAGLNLTSPLTASNGGTGINTSASTGVPTLSSGTWSIASSLGITLGGTGVTSATDLENLVESYVFDADAETISGIWTSG
jgi:hypothetical protein